MHSACFSLLEFVGDTRMRHAGTYAASVCQPVDGLAPGKRCRAQGHLSCPELSVLSSWSIKDIA